MSGTLLKSPLLNLEDLGPKVVIVDDSYNDGLPLVKALDALNVRNRFFQVDFTNPAYPEQPLADVQLIFMDLYFNEGFGASFDPYMCMSWLARIVPEGQKYVLVVWSRDADRGGELIDQMRIDKVTLPYYWEARNKSDYRNKENQYNASLLLDDVGRELVENVATERLQFLGRILEVDSDDDSVLINCLMDEKQHIFEVRRFPLLPLRNIMPIEPNAFLRIDITTKPGSTIIEFTPEKEDHSKLFVKPDPKDFGDIAWLNTPEE